jgi:hypothetical protein
MLALRQGPLPEAAVSKALAAYGDDVMRKLEWVRAALADPHRRNETAIALGMDGATLTAAINALDSAIGR